MSDTYAVVWCSSPRGLISYECKPPSNLPIEHQDPPKNTIVVNSDSELFDILVRRDGTKVCFPYDNLYDYFGWTT